MRRSPLTMPAAIVVLVVTFVLAAAVFTAMPPSPAGAAPASVTLAGSFQSELGCGSDWDAGCAATHLARSTVAPIWSASFALPAGTYDYKIAVDDSWTVNYGAHGVAGGTQLTLVLAAPTTVRFYFDETTHWIADSRNDVIATVAGDFQSEVGCLADWAPDCQIALLEDIDGDGLATRTVVGIPGGWYTMKVAIDETWDVHYGAGGSPTGADISLFVPAGSATTFAFDEHSHQLKSTPSHFIDVTGANTFRGDIEWMVTAGITTGYPDSSFHPTEQVPRQAMAAFLYRDAGAPNGAHPTCLTKPFADVPVASMFCGEIAWMKNAVITKGYPDGSFHPSEPVRREAMAAYLFRVTFGGLTPTPCTRKPFTDVAPSDTFCPQIAWMKAAAITKGYPDGSFHPTEPVARQAMAAFLHRLAT